MKKSDNLIVRIDPELRNILEKRAKEKKISKSELIRNILGVIFLEDYENEKVKVLVINEIGKSKIALKEIIDQALIKRENPRLSNFISKVENYLLICNEIENLLNISQK